MKKILESVFNVVVFITGVSLVVINQKTVGVTNLLWMVLGFAMLIFLIWKYNRKYI